VIFGVAANANVAFSLMTEEKSWNSWELPSQRPRQISYLASCQAYLSQEL